MVRSSLDSYIHSPRSHLGFSLYSPRNTVELFYTGITTQTHLVSQANQEPNLVSQADQEPHLVSQADQEPRWFHRKIHQSNLVSQAYQEPNLVSQAYQEHIQEKIR